MASTLFLTKENAIHILLRLYKKMPGEASEHFQPINQLSTIY